MNRDCYVYKQDTYDTYEIAKLIEKHIEASPGQQVFIKPNWVMEPWPGEEKEWTAVVTHPAVIEAVLNVLKNKMNGRGHIIIGDAPMARTKIEKIWDKINLDDLITRYKSESFQIQKMDLRNYYWCYIADTCIRRVPLAGDPKGNADVNLGSDSMFIGKKNGNYMMTDTKNPISEYHDQKIHRYIVSRSILECDVFINLPKLKTHRIAGLTCAMKNLVGTIGIKSCIPHSTYGSDQEGGDFFPYGEKNVVDGQHGIRGIVDRIERRKVPFINCCMIPMKFVYHKFFAKKDKNKLGYGAWYGNDTIWRSIIDLNKIIFYSDNNGHMQKSRQRKYICIVDAIIAGEGEGPMHPLRKQCNLILAGENPVSIDATACKIMGFDFQKIPFLANAFKQDGDMPLVDFTYEDICIHSNMDTWNAKSLTELSNKEMYHFVPSCGWQGHIE